MWKGGKRRLTVMATKQRLSYDQLEIGGRINSP